MSNKKVKNLDNNIKFIEDKIKLFQDIIQNTIISSQKYKILDILNTHEINICIQNLEKIFNYLNTISNKIADNNYFNIDDILNNLQNINNELSSIIKNYGTNYFNDLITICLGQDIISTICNTTILYDKFNLLTKYAHPINYKVLPWKKNENKKINKDLILQKNKIIEDNVIVENANNLDCFDLARTSRNFQTRVYGIKICIHDNIQKQTLIIYAVVDDILLGCLNNSLISSTNKSIESEKPLDKEFQEPSWNKFIESLTLKQYLIYNNTDLYDKYLNYINQIKIFKKKSINQLIKEFLGNELYSQRTMLIQLLTKSYEPEFQYLAYLLYDLLSNDNNNNIDTQEQTLLFDSLPWAVKKYFRDSMKQTIEYTNNLLNFDNNKIPIEQQICLLKTNDNVKEKAMQKLKEVKSKSDDSGSKARQYLDGLLKIPFGIYVEESILTKSNTIKNIFNEIIHPLNTINNIIEYKESYSNIEIIHYINLIKNTNIINIIKNLYFNNIFEVINRNNIISISNNINKIIKKYELKNIKISTSNKPIDNIKNQIELFINSIINNKEIFDDIINLTTSQKNNLLILNNLNSYINQIENYNMEITNYIKNTNIILDSAVYGHTKAKRQVERIIGQWINGEKTGYCLGFEGPPGVGKCFTKDTPIMLSNGEIKMVQNITTEDKLMGDDSTPRNVLALGSGLEKMYKIEQIKGDDYIVNESHILSLKMTKAGQKGDKHQMILGRRYFKNDIVDICIKDYLSLPKYLQECLKGYKVGLNFVEKELDLDPYALGYWLGDGDSSTFRISTIEKEIVDYFKEYASSNNLQITQGKTEKSKITYHLTAGFIGGRNDKNKLLNYLKNHNLINNKHIPEIYKCNSRENRLKLLAGLIDCDGYYNKVNNSLEITQKNKKLADDILFLVRSLGFCGTMKECTKSCIYKDEKKLGQYHRIIISGSGREEIPVLLERKRPKEHKQIKDGLNTGIRIVPLEEDKYYGFQIDGNSRFLLGDFTVTHNTSLAKKGIANCLIDENNNSRPFAFIAIGGSSNGSTLDGHNYTYVGSTWGKIVDILIEHKCMNPIIFIDELDKISRTEQGKEIIGILTHLIDSTQNDCFQDKYFNGIDLDLSKALFIFSYNDVDLIDKILLDRIHRIKFEHLTLEDKLVITNKYIIPEISKKFGLEKIIEINDDIIKYIINNYTSESGVRKLKEILFEIIGEINLNILKKNEKYNIPIKLTTDIIKELLNDRPEINKIKINKLPKIGIINGLWANYMGQGGILHIEANFFISSTLFDLKLTGMQGDVMKESMSVAKTLACSLLSSETITDLSIEYEKTKLQGIHIHVPEGATPKDGPSAGTAITIVIYSLLTKRTINNNIAITGEICLQGNISAIGGLDLKIIGGINAGVTKFIFPKENLKDFNLFMNKYKNLDILKNIEFISVEHISEVLKIIFI